MSIPGEVLRGQTKQQFLKSAAKDFKRQVKRRAARVEVDGNSRDHFAQIINSSIPIITSLTLDDDIMDDANFNSNVTLKDQEEFEAMLKQ